MMDKQLIKMSGSDSLYRDSSSMAILNTNQSEYKQYVNMRSAQRHKQDQIDRHERDINSIKEDIAEIKSLLLSIYQR